MKRSQLLPAIWPISARIAMNQAPCITAPHTHYHFATKDYLA